MELPERKSQKIEVTILKFKEDLNELKLSHERISSEILNLTLKLLDSERREDRIGIMESLEDLNYEMDNDILMNLEMTFESIGGLEIESVETDYYILSIKEERDLLQHLEMSAKNLIKTASVNDNTLSAKEMENLNYLCKSYKKSVAKTQLGITELYKQLDSSFLKVKKIEKL